MPPSLARGSRLAARWNRLGETAKTRKKWQKTGSKWSRDGRQSVKRERPAWISCRSTILSPSEPLLPGGSRRTPRVYGNVSGFCESHRNCALDQLVILETAAEMVRLGRKNVRGGWGEGWGGVGHLCAAVEHAVEGGNRGEPPLFVALARQPAGRGAVELHLPDRLLLVEAVEPALVRGERDDVLRRADLLPRLAPRLCAHPRNSAPIYKWRGCRWRRECGLWGGEGWLPLERASFQRVLSTHEAYLRPRPAPRSVRARLQRGKPPAGGLRTARCRRCH